MFYYVKSEDTTTFLGQVSLEIQECLVSVGMVLISPAGGFFVAKNRLRYQLVMSCLLGTLGCPLKSRDVHEYCPLKAGRRWFLLVRCLILIESVL